jgi:hypothetical protein
MRLQWLILLLRWYNLLTFYLLLACSLLLLIVLFASSVLFDLLFSVPSCTCIFGGSSHPQTFTVEGVRYTAYWQGVLGV